MRRDPGSPQRASPGRASRKIGAAAGSRRDLLVSPRYRSRARMLPWRSPGEMRFREGAGTAMDAESCSGWACSAEQSLAQGTEKGKREGRGYNRTRKTSSRELPGRAIVVLKELIGTRIPDDFFRF